MVTGASAIKLLLIFVARCNISIGCGEDSDLFDEAKWLLNIEALPVGAKPVKNPITKHKEKWTTAFFHSCTFFFDLSKDPIFFFFFYTLKKDWNHKIWSGNSSQSQY